MVVEGLAGSEAAALCASVDSREGRICLTLERRVLELLEAGCHEPIGVYSQICQGKARLWGISSRKGCIRRVCLESGLTPRELELLAQEAAGKLSL